MGPVPRSSFPCVSISPISWRYLCAMYFTHTACCPCKQEVKYRKLEEGPDDFGPRLSVLAPPVLLHDPPVRKLHPLHQACILKRLRSSTGLAHRDVRPAALRQEAVPRFLICAAPGATCAPVSASAQPVEAFLNLTLGSHTVACVGAIGNVQGAAAIPADQDIPGIVHTPAEIGRASCRERV